MSVITLGSFEIMHYGHINLFDKCRSMTDGKVVVGLNTDAFIKKYKGFLPAMTYEERKKNIMALGIVDEVLENDQPNGSAKELIKKSGANLIVVGSDWAIKDYVGQLGLNWDWLDRQGIGICYVNYTKGISTTKIKERLRGM